MQSERGPKLFLVVIFFCSKVWNLIKFFVNLTNFGDDDYQSKNLSTASSRNSYICHQDKGDLSHTWVSDDSHHFHGEKSRRTSSDIEASS